MSRTRFNDLEGKRFDRWTVLSLSSQVSRTGALYWSVICDCGTASLVRGTALTGGKSGSCGCQIRELVAKARRTHGKSRDPIYYVWNSMLARCSNPRATAYRNYGGRGISVCPAWMIFEAFYADMGDPPFVGAELDRKDNNFGYEPGNCRWVTPTVNGRNRRNNRLVTHQGREMCLAEASILSGVRSATLSERNAKGWTGERLFSDPTKRSHRTRNEKGQYA